MVRKYEKVYEAPISLGETLNATMGDLYHEKNYIDALIRISLNSLKYNTPNEIKLEIGDFIKSVIACYECCQPQYVKETANNILNISQILGKNPKFMYTVGKLIAIKLTKVTYEYEGLYNFLTKHQGIGIILCKDFDDFFTKEFLSISPELYYILKNADLENIVKDFDNDETFVTSKIFTSIADPLNAALEELLTYEKALIFDKMFLQKSI